MLHLTNEKCRELDLVHLHINLHELTFNIDELASAGYTWSNTGILNHIVENFKLFNHDFYCKTFLTILHVPIKCLIKNIIIITYTMFIQ